MQQAMALYQYIIVTLNPESVKHNREKLLLKENNVSQGIHPLL
jgi:hypothetical protein